MGKKGKNDVKSGEIGRGDAKNGKKVGEGGKRRVDIKSKKKGGWKEWEKGPLGDK